MRNFIPQLRHDYPAEETNGMVLILSCQVELEDPSVHEMIDEINAVHQFICQRRLLSLIQFNRFYRQFLKYFLPQHVSQRADPARLTPMVLTPLDLNAHEHSSRVIKHRGDGMRQKKLVHKCCNCLLCPHFRQGSSKGVPQHQLHTSVLAEALLNSRSESLQTCLEHIFALVYD